MKMRLILLAVLPALTGAAEPPSDLPERYLKALRGHDLNAVSQLMDDSARIEVIWTDVSPAQHFTLSKAEYLQQSRAVWRFGRDESYEFSPVIWKTDTASGARLAVFRETEKRSLFGNAAGQRSDLTVRLSADGRKITGIQAMVSMW